jgi:hypothetical protein
LKKGTLVLFPADGFAEQSKNMMLFLAYHDQG